MTLRPACRNLIKRPLLASETETTAKNVSTFKPELE